MDRLRVTLTLSLGWVALWASACCAEDLSTAITKAFSQIPEGADVAAMGNASTATPAFSSHNPAIIAVETEDGSKFGSQVSYGNIGSGSGMNVNFYSASASARLPVGALQAIIANGGSTRSALSDVDSAQLNSTPSIEVQYGARVAAGLLTDDVLYGGVSYTYSRSKLTFHSILSSPPPSELTAVSEGSGHAAGVGMLYRAWKRVSVGALWTHSWDTTEETTSLDGLTADRTKAKSQTDELRVGISWQATPLTLVAADYRHLFLPGGEKDDQYFAGIEQGIVKDLFYLYGGWANGGTTAGLGLYLPHGGLNLAYARRPLRSLEQFFGKADLLMASLYLNF